MKRLVSFILILSMLLCALSTGLTASAYYGADEYAYAYMTMSAYEVEAGGEIDVTVHLMPDTDIEVSCIQFYVQCNYRNGWSFPFTYKTSSEVLSDEFSTATVAQSSYDEPIKFLWESVESVVIPGNKATALGTFTIKTDAEALEGEYDFTIYFDVLSYYSLENSDFEDISVIYNSYPESVWVGERLTVYNSLFKIPLGGTEDYFYEIYTNKPIDTEQTYIFDTNVAEIIEIVNSDSGARIRVRGKQLNGITSMCVVSADYDLYEEVWATIKVTEPSSIIISMSSKPEKTVYYIGEKCDKATILDGLSVVVHYDNYEEESLSSLDDFTVGEYDFTTAGTKYIRVYCADSYITLKYTVKATPNSIKSSLFPSDSTTIYDIPEGTKVEDLLDSIDVSDRLTIYDAENKVVTDGIVKTGMRAEFVIDGKIIAKSNIVVKYDLDGDGAAGIKDLVVAKKSALGSYSLSGAYLRAAGLKSGKPNAQTLVLIKKYLLQ